jgi:hypothetical protein
MAERRSTVFDAMLTERSFESIDAWPVNPGGRPPPGDPYTPM